MIKVAIFPLGLFVKPQPQRSINAFAKLGISKLALLWNWLPLPTYLRRFQKTYLPDVFDSYREGKITTEQFRKTAEFFVSNLSPQAFDAAWNAQCLLSDYAKKAFDEAELLIEQGVEVYFFSGTNPLHVASIEKQHGKPIPGIHYFSYEHKKLNNDLTKDLLAHIQQKHKGILPQEVAFLYSKPIEPYPTLGFWGWLWAPFQRWFYQRAVRDVDNLQHLTKDKVTLVEHSNTAAPMLLTTLGLNPKPETKSVQRSRCKPILIARAPKQTTLKQQARQGSSVQNRQARAKSKPQNTK